MKTITLALTMCLITTVAFAHHIENVCWGQGRFKIAGHDFPTTGKVRYRVFSDAGHNILLKDTTFASQADWYASVPQSNQFQPVYIQAYYQNTNGTVSLNHADWARDYTTNSDKCPSQSLPLTWGEFKTEKVGVNQVKISVTVYDVTNVKNITFEMRKLNDEGWQTVSLIFPENVQTAHVYTTTIKIN